MFRYFTKLLLGFVALILGSVVSHGQNPNQLLTYSTSAACPTATNFCPGTVTSGATVYYVTSAVQNLNRLLDLNDFNTTNHDSALIKNVRFSVTILRNFEVTPQTFNYTVRLYKVTGAGYSAANRTLIATANSNSHTIPAGNGTFTGFAQQVYQQFSATFNRRVGGHDTIAIEVTHPDFFGSNIWVIPYFGLRSESKQSSYYDAPLCAVTNFTSIYATLNPQFAPIGCPDIGLDIEANAEFFSLPDTPVFTQFKDTICAGATGVEYAIAPVTHASSYVWAYTGGGITINGTGTNVTISASNSATSGFLTVKAVNYYGESQLASRFIQVDSIFNISLNVNNPVVCLGDSVFLEGPPGFSSYRWEPPTGLSSLTNRATWAGPQNSHSYTLSVEDIYGCRGVGSTHVAINPGPYVATNPMSLGICEDSISINLSGATSYAWQPTTGIASPTGNFTKAKPNATTNYIIVATDSMGCVRENPVTIQVFNPANVNITRNGRILTGPTGYQSYRWYLNGQPVVPAAIFNQYNAKTDGVYTLVVTDENGCVITSNEINISDGLSVNDLGIDKVKIYPNPTKNTLFIETDLDVNFVLYSIDGKTLLSMSNSKQVDMSNLSTGMYYLVVEDAATQAKASFKVMKSE